VKAQIRKPMTFCRSWKDNTMITIPEGTQVEVMSIHDMTRAQVDWYRQAEKRAKKENPGLRIIPFWWEEGLRTALSPTEVVVLGSRPDKRLHHVQKAHPQHADNFHPDGVRKLEQRDETFKKDG